MGADQQWTREDWQIQKLRWSCCPPRQSHPGWGEQKTSTSSCRAQQDCPGWGISYLDLNSLTLPLPASFQGMKKRFWNLWSCFLVSDINLGVVTVSYHGNPRTALRGQIVNSILQMKQVRFRAQLTQHLTVKVAWSQVKHWNYTGSLTWVSLDVYQSHTPLLGAQTLTLGTGNARTLLGVAGTGPTARPLAGLLCHITTNGAPTMC